MNNMQEFTVQQSGNIGQEILDANGTVICWTTDPWLAQVIAELLTHANANGLMMQAKEGIVWVIQPGLRARLG